MHRYKAGYSIPAGALVTIGRAWKAGEGVTETNTVNEGALNLIKVLVELGCSPCLYYLKDNKNNYKADRLFYINLCRSYDSFMRSFPDRMPKEISVQPIEQRFTGKPSQKFNKTKSVEEATVTSISSPEKHLLDSIIRMAINDYELPMIQYLAIMISHMLNMLQLVDEQSRNTPEYQQLKFLTAWFMTIGKIDSKVKEPIDNARMLGVNDRFLIEELEKGIGILSTVDIQRLQKASEFLLRLESEFEKSNNQNLKTLINNWKGHIEKQRNKCSKVKIEKEWYSDDTVNKLLEKLIVGRKNITILAAANVLQRNDNLGQDISLKNQLEVCLNEPGQYIIPLHVHALEGTFGNTNHWTALIVGVNQKRQITNLQFIDPTGRNEVYDGVKNSLSILEFSKENLNKIKRYFDEEYHPQHIEIAEVFGYAYIDGDKSNDYDCGPFMVEALRRIVCEENIQGMCKNNLEESIKYGQDLREEHQLLLKVKAQPSNPNNDEFRDPSSHQGDPEGDSPSGSDSGKEVNNLKNSPNVNKNNLKDTTDSQHPPETDSTYGKGKPKDSDRTPNLDEEQRKPSRTYRNLPSFALRGLLQELLSRFDEINANSQKFSEVLQKVDEEGLLSKFNLLGLLDQATEDKLLPVAQRKLKELESSRGLDVEAIDRESHKVFNNYLKKSPYIMRSFNVSGIAGIIDSATKLLIQEQAAKQQLEQENEGQTISIGIKV
jgi:hypothetical protein